MPRLASPRDVARWRAALAAGTAAAAAAQRRRVGANLSALGAGWDDPAGVRPLTTAWDQPAWARAIETHLAPAALAVAGAAVAVSRASLPVRVTWGTADPVPGLAGSVLVRATGAGAAIGRRFETITVEGARERFGGVEHENAMSTLGDVWTSAISNLSGLVDRMAGHIGNGAQAAVAEAVAANQPDAVLNVWRSAFLDTTRPEHSDADGQEQRPGDPFDVGGEDLLYPGDPNGSDGNVCNCVCWLETIGGAFDDVSVDESPAEDDSGEASTEAA